MKLPQTNDSATSLISLLPSKYDKLVFGVTVGLAAFRLARKVAEKVKEKRSVTLKFYSGTEEYGLLCKWLENQDRCTADKCNCYSPRVSIGNTNRLKSCEPLAPVTQPYCFSDKADVKWSLFPDNNASYKWGGVDITVSNDKISKSDDGSFRSSMLLILSSNKLDSINSLLDDILKVGSDVDKVRTLYVRRLGNWHDWISVKRLRDGMPVLPESTFSELIADADEFERSEDWYSSCGIGYHRGYLFHGIPGSGKTTTAAALAKALGRDVCILQLDGVSDEQIMSGISNLDGRSSLLLIEDIDCVCSTHTREEQQNSDKKQPTLQGLLNALDGVASKDGLITVMTTNRPEVLDKALLRPGRVDKKIKFTYACNKQIEELSERFGFNKDRSMCIRNELRSIYKEKVSMAEVQEYLINKKREEQQ